MSRVLWEYLDALLLPLNLSPTYYSRAGVFGPLYRLAALSLPLVALLALVSWRYGGVWRDDVTAWTRVLARHP